MKITESHTVTLEIDGVRKKISIAEAQELYDALGAVVGVRRHQTPYPSWPYYPYWRYGTTTSGQLSYTDIEGNATTTTINSASTNTNSVRVLQDVA